MAESAIEKLRAYNFDKKRLAKVNNEIFNGELMALTSQEKACQRMLDLVSQHKKLPNINNSIVGYVLGITDELPKGSPKIYFSKELPDIDIDFESDRRHEVKEYLEGLYGSDKIANLATFGTFKGKMCLTDLGRVFADRIPWEAVEECKRLVVERSSADSRAGFTIEDTFTNFEQAAGHLKKYPELSYAKELEGQIRHLSVHAAGIVISNEPIGDFAAVYRTKNGDKVISMDYTDATSVGLLKIDILGLTALNAMKSTLKLIKQRYNKKIDVNLLPLDDYRVFENFCKQRLHGIFQFEGESTRQVCRQVQPKEFKDIVAINALSRPGPLNSGGTTHFIERRFGREKIKKIHPIYDDIVKDTYGIAVYQEQVMKTVRDMGKFSWKETATIRQAMSKKYGDEFFANMRKRFVEGATSQGVKTEVALEIFAAICSFGSWAFNFAHSVAYSVMAYQLMWLKTHYPVEFYASVIACEPDEIKQRKLYKEYGKAGFAKLLPVCVNNSKDSVSCDKSGLRLGLDAVEGLNTKHRGLIVQNQPYRDFVDFKKRCRIPSRHSETLLKIGAFRNLKFTSLAAQSDLFGATESQRSDFDYKNPDERLVRELCPLAADSDTGEKWEGWMHDNVKGKLWTITELDEISEKTSVMIIGHTDPRSRFNLKNKMEEASSRGREWKAKEGEEDLTREDYNFINFDLEDDTDSIIVRVSYNIYPRYKKMLWDLKPDDVVGVRGMMTGIQRMLFSYTVVNLTELRRKVEAKEKLTSLESQFLTGEKQKWRY